jgi:hypothetical protein
VSWTQPQAYKSGWRTASPLYSFAMPSASATERNTLQSTRIKTADLGIGTGSASLVFAERAVSILCNLLKRCRALAEIERSGQRVDFAFIDGWHTFDFALVDFFFIDRISSVGGVVVFDDANWPAIRKVCRFVKTNLGLLHRGCRRPRSGTVAKAPPLGALVASRTI